MGRPVNPDIKSKLLEKCVAAATSAGSINLTIHEYASAAKTSARMLIYHFGSKAELDGQIALEVDRLMKIEFTKALGKKNTRQHVLLSFWDQITCNTKLGRLAALTMTMAIPGHHSSALMKQMEDEASKWIQLIRSHFKSCEAAETAFLVAQGAMIDFFMTGNKDRGRRCISGLLRDTR